MPSSTGEDELTGAPVGGTDEGAAGTSEAEDGGAGEGTGEIERGAMPEPLDEAGGSPAGIAGSAASGIVGEAAASSLGIEGRAGPEIAGEAGLPAHGIARREAPGVADEAGPETDSGGGGADEEDAPIDWTKPVEPPPDLARVMAGVVALAQDSDDVAPLTREPPRVVGILLALASAACLVAACFSHRWLANKHLGDFGYSPLSFEQCGTRAEPIDSGPPRSKERRCETVSNFQVFAIANNSPFEEDRVSVAFPVGGLVTFIVLLVAAAGLVVAAGISTANKRPNLPVSPTTFALLGIMIGLISGCVFVATKPGGVGAIGVAWSFWAFGIGSVAGIAGAQLLAKQIRPPDPDLLHDAMNPDQF